MENNSFHEVKNDEVIFKNIISSPFNILTDEKIKEEFLNTPNYFKSSFSEIVKNTKIPRKTIEDFTKISRSNKKICFEKSEDEIIHLDKSKFQIPVLSEKDFEDIRKIDGVISKQINQCINIILEVYMEGEL